MINQLLYSSLKKKKKNEKREGNSQSLEEELTRVKEAYITYRSRVTLQTYFPPLFLFGGGIILVVAGFLISRIYRKKV
jgi:hypothetical protein